MVTNNITTYLEQSSPNASSKSGLNLTVSSIKMVTNNTTTYSLRTDLMNTASNLDVTLNGEVDVIPCHKINLLN